MLPISTFSSTRTSTINKSTTTSTSTSTIKSSSFTSSFTSSSTLSSTNNDEFIDYILSPPSDDPSFRCTHMIGIPLEQNHDLILELESVQRAILYHCPLLINACVAPVVTRMPLLLVDTKIKSNTNMNANTNANANMETSNSIANTDDNDFSNLDVDDLFGRKNAILNGNSNSIQDVSSSTSTSPGENELLTSRDPVTRALHEIVNSVVKEMIDVPSKVPEPSSSDTTDTTDDNTDDEEEQENRDGLNNNNIKPLLMKFQGLEIDGDMNEILHAIGTEEDGVPLLRKVMNEITARIEKKGWRAYVPEDNPQGKMGGLNEDGVTWRPRIPFMRLPNDFYETLPDPKGYDGQWQNYSDEEKQRYMREPEEGGNGISPLFWFKWWEDKFCNGRSVRIRELAVYGRTGPMGMSEQAFYIPHLRTRLPDGNEVLQEDERKDREYDNERRLEQEIMIDDFEVTETSSIETTFEKDMATYKSDADRRILQTIFDSSPNDSDLFNIAETIGNFDFEEGSSDESEIVESSTVPEEKSVVDKEIVVVDESQKKSSDSTTITNEAKEKKEEIIQSIAKPMATGDWSKFPKKKDKPKPEDNPILRNWKQRVAETPKILDVKNNENKLLPPFPSDEHFVGIWRLESTPGTNIIEEEGLFSDPNSSENLVLRIDGTTAGGPILDLQNQHRAAGGTWKFFQAQWIGPTGQEVDTEPVLKTRLRIRLLIPPLKEKVLVMEGEVKQGALVSPESISQANINELRKSSFESLLNTKEKKDNKEVKDDSFIQCSGEMWTEDVGGKNRYKLGRFSLSKRKDQGSAYNYSIPSPQRYQD